MVLVIDLIAQLSCDVIGHLSKKKNYKKVKKTEPLDWKKAKDKYFLKKLDNNKNNDDGLLTDPLGGSSLLKYINYN